MPTDAVDEYTLPMFPGDDLLALMRPCGLPIGNLTSQFWSNCYMNPFDHFVKRELRCPAYLRYVDDLAIFSDSKRELWQWKNAILQRLASMRLKAMSLAWHHPVALARPARKKLGPLGFQLEVCCITALRFYLSARATQSKRS